MHNYNHVQKPKAKPIPEKRVINTPKMISQTNNDAPNPFVDSHLQQKDNQRQVKNASINKGKDMWINLEDNNTLIGIRPNSVYGQSRPQSTVSGDNPKLTNYSVRPKTNGGLLYGGGHKQSQSISHNNQSYSLMRLNTVTPTNKSLLKTRVSPSKDMTTKSKRFCNQRHLRNIKFR